MNWINSHNRVDEGVTVGSCRIKRLRFADDLVLLESSQQSLPKAIDRFSAAWHRPGVKISAKNTEVLLYVSLQTQGSVCSKWAALHCSRWRRQVPRGGIYVWRKAEPQDIDTRIGLKWMVSNELVSIVCTPSGPANSKRPTTFNQLVK